jgi:predicted alpha/beta hydrolase
LAEGEGRNAVFLARHGYHVSAVDLSEVGLQKLAATQGVPIECIHADLATFDLSESG